MMMLSFLSRALLMVFGYAYPAYECFKTVEKNKPEIEQLLFWCHYWILAAMFTVGDTLISWLPMYSEAKLAFFIYLWYPKTKGTAYVYNVILRPYIAKHETEIDLNLLKLRVKARQMGFLIWEKAAFYGQTRFLEILQYLSSHSASLLLHSDQHHELVPGSSAQSLSQQQQQQHQEPAEEAGNSPASSPCFQTTDESQIRNKEVTSTETDKTETRTVSYFGNGNSCSVKQEAAVSNKQAVSPRSRIKWRFFRTAANR